jgi:cyclopropane fatty-acyl-phospholipid synthase-like methyltransferase
MATMPSAEHNLNNNENIGWRAGIAACVPVTTSITLIYIIFALIFNFSEIIARHLFKEQFQLWLSVTAEITSFVGHYLPTLDYMRSYLAKHGDAQSIPIFENVITVNWIFYFWYSFRR